MNPEVRAYMAEIGRKGGKAGKGTPKRAEVARKAAKARWAKAKAKAAKPKLSREDEAFWREIMGR